MNNPIKHVGHPDRGAGVLVILHQANSIGEGAVIGIRAVVTKPVPAWEIWAGNPVRKVGERI